MENLLNRFLRYVQIDTQSDPESKTSPSTVKQFDLAKLLVEELRELGLSDVKLDEHCYVYATLPGNVDRQVPVIGFIAHLDTTPDFTGHNVKPLVHENYDGGDLVLNKDLNIILSPKEFPELTNYKGQTLITSDGTTLLGEDDKAGIAEIMAALEYLINNPQIKHGKIRVAFTPDEEIGRGTEHFDVQGFGADFAYTVDGGPIGELEFENFNAAEAKVFVHGKNVHPGTAKNKMINSIRVAMEFDSLLPQHERPEHTEGYEGFYHLMSFKGDVEQSQLHYIIRDHDRQKFEARKQLFKHIAEFLNKKYNRELVELSLRDQYYNMREKIEPVMYIVDLAKRAMQEVGVEPKIKPIRGGTDGAMLSFKGLPTPNIFTGGHNFHGRYEYIPLQSMQKAVEVIVKIAEMAVEL